MSYLPLLLTVAGDVDTFRNGKQTNTPNYRKPNNMNDPSTRKAGDVSKDRGLHESWNWYNKCYMRERNKGECVVYY